MSRIAANRALARWAWRMFRRDWRSQSLVLALLGVAVMVSSYGAAVGHALAPSDQASFGSASARLVFDAADPAAAAEAQAAAARELGAVEAIADAFVPIPGSVRQLDLRVQDPRAALGAGTLRLSAGRYPDGDAEIALSTAMSQFLAAPLGASVAVGDVRRQVVGLVENPARLDEGFGLVTALPPVAAIRCTLLVKAPPERLAAARAALTALLGPDGVTLERPVYYSRDLGVLLVAALGMILVAVLALTAFLVLAQRRVRQLGMLAAVGATRRQVRNVTVFHGLIVGALGAVAGTAAAAAGWAATGSAISRASGQRVSWGGVPLWLIVAPGAMGMAASALAAWWPARSMARVPVVRALSNRPLEAPAGRSWAIAAIAAALIGALCLRLSHQRNAALMIAGIAAMVGSVLCAAPLVLRAATARCSRLPVSARLAWRELGRNQSRSAAALATVAVAVGMSVAAVVVTAANTHPPSAGDLSDRQMLISAADSRDPAALSPPDAAQIAALDAAAAQLAALLPGAALIPVSPAVAEARQWSSVRAGWLLQNPAPLSAPQREAARVRAAALGLAIETRDPQTYLGRLRLMFSLGGIVVTLAVIAIALALLRVQTVRDRQILTAVGASRRSRRAMAAVTATTLAALGAALGLAGAYATLILAYSDTLSRLRTIPWSALGAVVLGVPVLALGATWLGAGRQPPSVGRPSID
ncbi:MAG: hypothetical protein LBQ06_07565 [Frankiaceae bacterium]|nr:hypothetical protein [Frankiaceae bacterium]